MVVNGAVTGNVWFAVVDQRPLPTHSGPNRLGPIQGTQPDYLSDEFWNVLPRVGNEIVICLGCAQHFDILSARFYKVRPGEALSPLKARTPWACRGGLATPMNLRNLTVG